MTNGRRFAFLLLVALALTLVGWWVLSHETPRPELLPAVSEPPGESSSEEAPSVSSRVEPAPAPVVAEAVPLTVVVAPHEEPPVDDEEQEPVVLPPARDEGESENSPVEVDERSALDRVSEARSDESLPPVEALPVVGAVAGRLSLREARLARREHDREPPWLVDVELPGGRILPHQLVHVPLKLADEHGRPELARAVFVHEHGEERQENTCLVERDGETCVLGLVHRSGMTPGAWLLLSLTLTDDADNERVVTQRPDGSPLGFVTELVDTSSDDLPPQLHEARLEPDVLVEGEEAVLTARVSDEGLGVRWVHARFESPSGGARHEMRLTDQGDGTWSARWAPKLGSELGRWQLQWLGAMDMAGLVTGWSRRDAAVLGLGFELLPAERDREPPRLLELGTSVTPLESGAFELVVTLEIFEESSFPVTGRALIETVDGAHRRKLGFMAEEGGTPDRLVARAELDVPTGETWSFVNLYLEDALGNFETYRQGFDAVLEGVDFVVEGAGDVSPVPVLLVAER
ncbi:MAG: hypothetical protein AAF533_27950 [Acidobacteriota bacterium]